MKYFQILSLAIISILILFTLAGIYKQESRNRYGFYWLLVWTTAAIALSNPNGTTYIANALGIDRGADFIFYCAVLGGMVGFFILYSRLRQLNRELTLLVRELALRDARQPISDSTEN